MATTPPQTLVNVSADPALNTIYPATAQSIPPVTNASIYITDKTEYITNIINSAVAGGQTDEVQFNVGDKLVGDSGLTYDMDTDTLTVTGNVIAGNLKTDHLLYANGTSWSFSGSTYSNSNVANYLVTYTGNINANTIVASVFSGNHYGNGSGLTSVPGANVTGYVPNATNANSATTATSATTSGTVTTAAQPNITSVGTLTGLTVTATMFGSIHGSANTVRTPAQPNITSVGTLSSLTLSGNITMQTNAQMSMSNATQSTSTTTGALRVVGGIASEGNIHANHIHASYTLNAGQHLFAGNNAQGSSFQSQVMVGKDTATAYVQSAMVNSADTGSADWIAYGESGSDLQGWNDLGFTGTNFNDANYTITKASDGYIFTQGMSGQGGNLVLATGDTGAVAYRDIIFATGGFANTNEKLRITNTNKLIPYSNASMDLGDVTHYFGNTYVNNVTISGATTLSNVGNVKIAGGTNGQVLTTDGAGNLSFTTISSANTGNVTFNDINIIGTGNLRLQPDETDSNAYLDVYLTSGPDIHIAGNGETVILGTDDFANVTVGVDGNVYIQASIGTPYTWSFGSDGILIAPGYITTTGNISGNYILGNGSQLTNLPAPTVSQDITSNGSMSIMTYDGNIKYVSYATVEPSTGNIAGGNISTTGNISGNYYIGNGSQLTGISVTSMVNGTSNVSVASSGNVTISVGGNANVITATTTGVNVTGTLTSTAKFGYASGSTVTQTTNRGQGVNINALAGTVITVSAGMTAGEIQVFTVTNNQVDAGNDIVLVQVVSPNLGNYNVIANPNSGIGGFYVILQNISGFPISAEAVTIRFMVIKAPNA